MLTYNVQITSFHILDQSLYRPFLLLSVLFLVTQYEEYYLFHKSCPR